MRHSAVHIQLSVRKQDAANSVVTTMSLEDTSMTPNRRLKQARELRGWSQAKVAEQIGTDATTVSRWERGLFSPTPYFRERLCALFSKNAEELGLLEPASSPEHDRGGFPLPPSRSLPVLQKHEDGQRDEPHTGPLIPPSWPKRADTFTYILHSASYDQQAHMLWEDAYVRALRGQRTEALRLGQASMNAFERVGHLNAGAVREWLDQRELLQSSPSSTSVQTVTTAPLPMHSDLKHKRTARRMIRRSGTGIALILFVLVGLFVVGFSVNQFAPAFLASMPVFHSTSNAKFAADLPTGLAGHVTATAVVVATAVPTRVPTPKSKPIEPATPDFRAVLKPSRLTHQNCSLEPLGYRCTLTLSLYGTNTNLISWSTSSGDLPVRFNPAQGKNHAGDSLQIIAYVQADPGENGHLIFSLTLSSTTIQAVVNWES